MVFINSLIFNTLFYLYTLILSIIFLPFIKNKNIIQSLGKHWSRACIIILNIVGIQHECLGNRQINKQVIYAAKHQSAWETIILYFELNAPKFVIKKELLNYPIVGFLFKAAGCIAIDRKNIRKSIKLLILKSNFENKEKKSIVIFPQGTRVEKNEKKPYKSGVFAIYKTSGLSVVPVALNSGTFWPKNGFMKYSGNIKIKFLDEIKPGMPKDKFMKKLENIIEKETIKLEMEK